METIREQLKALRDDMARADETTLRRDAGKYPPDERRTPLDWVAVRCEVRAWIERVDTLLAGKFKDSWRDR